MSQILKNKIEVFFLGGERERKDPESQRIKDLFEKLHMKGRAVKTKGPNYRPTPRYISLLVFFKIKRK